MTSLDVAVVSIGVIDPLPTPLSPIPASKLMAWNLFNNAWGFVFFLLLKFLENHFYSIHTRIF
jgi:hypothetical protein